ncbi:hypothetical protein F5882DRAFT_80484 [Hyaloscypha sp. PMI_1271]|nr:hypothetical protein F5882DRAFT_80484 [Hyaloscypha sp. PMI_1271]
MTSKPEDANIQVVKTLKSSNRTRRSSKLQAPRYIRIIFLPLPRKHMDKHTRPYKCPITECKVKDFSNAGDLRRHRREVHTSPAFTCPITTCKRHRKGFGRKDNLIQHLKRTHSEDTIESTPIMNGNEVTVASPNLESSTVSDSGESVGDEMEIVASKSTDKASLVIKLQELQALKEESIAKFDGDIAALKRVLSFM